MLSYGGVGTRNATMATLEEHTRRLMSDRHRTCKPGYDPRWYYTESCARAVLQEPDLSAPPTAVCMSARAIAPEGSTALGLAALHCKSETVRLLVLLGACADQEDPDLLSGEGPLHLACRCSR